MKAAKSGLCVDHLCLAYTREGQEGLTHLLTELYCNGHVLEEQKLAVTKEATDLCSSLSEVVKDHLEACRELQELRRQVCTTI